MATAVHGQQTGTRCLPGEQRMCGDMVGTTDRSRMIRAEGVDVLGGLQMGVTGVQIPA